MPRTSSGESARQRRTIGRVMHEFKHGELKRGGRGKAGNVKSRKQAIAIALHEAGASKYDPPKKQKATLARTKRKEARGKTAQQEYEGKSHVGARGRRESTRAMREEGATPLTRRKRPTRSSKATAPNASKSKRKGRKRRS